MSEWSIKYPYMKILGPPPQLLKEKQCGRCIEREHIVQVAIQRLKRFWGSLSGLTVITPEIFDALWDVEVALRVLTGEIMLEAAEEGLLGKPKENGQ